MLSRRGALPVLAFGLAICAKSPGFARSSRPASFAAIDADRDGTLDLQEVKDAASALFDEMDTDHDGSLSTRELRRRLSAADLHSTDGRGPATLTKDEFLGIVEKRFKAADADGDGTLSPAEFNSKAGLALRRLLH